MVVQVIPSSKLKFIIQVSCSCIKEWAYWQKLLLCG